MVDTERLKGLIKDSGRSITFVTKKMGLFSTASTYSKLSGRHPFTVEEALILCELLGIDSMAEMRELFFTH